MTAQAAQGDMAGLAMVYQRCIEALGEQLGLDPSPQTRALYDQLLKGEGLAAPIVTPKAQPERVETPAPPAASVQHNLPAPITGFVGREAQLAEIDRLLTEPATRLIKLTGVGAM